MSLSFKTGESIKYWCPFLMSRVNSTPSNAYAFLYTSDLVHIWICRLINLLGMYVRNKYGWMIWLMNEMMMMHGTWVDDAWLEEDTCTHSIWFFLFEGHFFFFFRLFVLWSLITVLYLTLASNIYTILLLILILNGFIYWLILSFVCWPKILYKFPKLTPLSNF